MDAQTLGYCVTEKTKGAIANHISKRKKLIPMEPYGQNLYLGDGGGIKFYSM